MLNGIKIRIQTDRFEETLRFYSEFFGLAVIREWSVAAGVGAILGLPDDSASGYLEVASGPESATSPAVSLQFRTDDLNRFINNLAGKVEHSAPEAKQWGSTYVYMTDPAGNRVIVFEGEV